MRVIAGEARHRLLKTPEGLNTRPMLDRIKQAVFDALGSHFGTPGLLPPLQVLDVFCGGGTLGIEALSRGAAFATFVESGREPLGCLQQNLATLRFESRARLCRGSADQVALGAAPAGFELVFLDPPFPLSAASGPNSVMWRLLGRLGQPGVLASDAVCIWRYELGHAPAAGILREWATLDQRTYGRSVVQWVRPAGRAARGGAAGD